MKKAVFVVSIVSMAVSSALYAEELGTIEVESTKLSDVSGEEVKSADLAEALTKKIPSISIVRRSGIANDIILRGQKKDNINILIDNGEQAMSGYGVVNMKVKHDITKKFELTAGIDNVLDKTFSTTNTYKDLTLLFDDSGDVMLINEPGRYLYVNAAYKF